ncbi:MAG: 3-deoxy-manno-octulosonate cytidylyltransferase [Cytophagaceae bacterium]|jgi:3-deoxy-manno-octulosonate cytidylyltransferase (CMP-KDO synthetase)|nr:3-deoxy-manno-octulosonate cytidylyltransferase [Cytophagaceae bacterium]
MRVIGIIPARYASTRFPAKALTPIKGKPMIQWVYERCRKSNLSDVVIATDHSLIEQAAKSFGAKVIMTSDAHPSGTDRCREVISKLNEPVDFVLNIQGDEPLIDPLQINLILTHLNPVIELATLKKKIRDIETLFNPNTPKVLCDNESNALYFSRETIPHLRGVNKEEWLNHFTYYKHIGIYAYRVDVLEKICQLPQGQLEKAESLEQLRWLENGFKIKVLETELESQGIDVPEDLKKIEPYLHLL